MLSVRAPPLFAAVGDALAARLPAADSFTVPPALRFSPFHPPARGYLLLTSRDHRRYANLSMGNFPLSKSHNCKLYVKNHNIRIVHFLN